MSSCSLGVQALRSSVQAAAHHLTRPCSRLLPVAAPFSNRCFSSWPSLPLQRQPRRGGRDGRNAAAGPALLRNARPVLPQWPGIRTLIGGPAVITHYVDLPPTYTDEEGLPFAKHDLEASEILAIFGPHMGSTTGNKLLRILHGRRVAGTLDDPMVRVNTMAYDTKSQRIALAYLRQYVPVDEIVNAGLRAEDELAALENGGTADAKQPESEPGSASKLKLYTKPDAKSVYGHGALDAIRAHNKAKYEAQLKQREEEEKKREEEERHGKAGPLQVAGKPQTRQLSAKMQEYMVRGQSDLKEPPQMPKWQRLLPSAAFVLVVSGLCLVYAEFYQPVKRADRWWPDIPPAAATVGSLILLNLLGWGLWKIPPIWGPLNRYFLIVAATPRAATMVSVMFSHQSFVHMLQNIAFLWFVGVRFHDDVGRGTFLATYFASGAVGALGTLTYAVMRSRLDLTSLGASGAIYGIGAAYLWLHRFESFRILGLPPPPSDGIQGLILLAFAAALNIGGAFTAARFKVDYTSHLVGLGIGVFAAHLVEKKKEAQQQPNGGVKQGEAAAVAAKTPLATK